MGTLPCSVTEAKTRPDLAGVNFARIEAAISEAVDATVELAGALGVPELAYGTGSYRVVHIARNTIRAGRMVATSS
jgi:hypothetical protein